MQTQRKKKERKEIEFLFSLFKCKLYVHQSTLAFPLKNLPFLSHHVVSALSYGLDTHILYHGGGVSRGENDCYTATKSMVSFLSFNDHLELVPSSMTEIFARPIEKSRPQGLAVEAILE